MRIRLAAVGLAVAGLLAAGCSSGTAGGGQPGTSATPAAAGASGTGAFGVKFARLVRFASCMRSHGVPRFPDPIAVNNGKPVFAVPNGSGVNQNSPQFSRAQQACRSLLADEGPAAPVITTQDQVDYLRAAQCMRDHGITGFPDPVITGNGGVHFPVPPGINTHSPQVAAAVAICRRLIPRGLPYSR